MDLFDADTMARHPKWNLWSRSRSKKRICITRDYKDVISVERVRTRKWRANIIGRPKESSPTFRKMEEAMLWAEERLPMIELARLA